MLQFMRPIRDNVKFCRCCAMPKLPLVSTRTSPDKPGLAGLQKPPPGRGDKIGVLILSDALRQ